MSRFEQNWWQHFIPECYFDTALVKALLGHPDKIWHMKGCNNVVNELNSKRLKGNFAVALIDKDKIELDYLKNCDQHLDDCKLRLWKHKNYQQFVIQLNPPLEKWILEVLDENGLKIEDYGYVRDYKKLKKSIKNDISSEKNDQLKRLIRAIVSTECEPVRKLQAMLLYLRDKNDQTDINELKNV